MNSQSLKPKPMEATIKDIIGKKAHWGSHTFEARRFEKTKVSISVYRNCPRKFEAMFIVKDTEELFKLSQDEQCSLRFYTGHLGGKRHLEENGKYYLVSTLEYFLNCFKHEIKNTCEIFGN